MLYYILSLFTNKDRMNYTSLVLSVSRTQALTLRTIFNKINKYL